MIPPLCASLDPVLAGPEVCSRGRWRSEPSKWRHTAAPEGRGQGAPRTCRCIETLKSLFCRGGSLRQGAPRTYRCIETVSPSLPPWAGQVREHHAPVGALRPCSTRRDRRQTCVREHHTPVGALRHPGVGFIHQFIKGQGAPRTCRCIETLACQRRSSSEPFSPGRPPDWPGTA